MGEFHSKAKGSVKLGTATEYIWDDFPKSPNLTPEDHRLVCGASLIRLRANTGNP